MTTETPQIAGRASPVSLLDRFLGATGVLSIYFCLVVVFAAEAIGHPTPSIFTDELKWSQFARGIAEHGTASIRGESVSFQSLYVYLIAPAWWIHRTASAYATVQYLNVFAMTLALVPAYLLARRLVSKPAALLVAAATAATPAMAYALAIVPEVVAYPWATLCAWLIVEALARRTRRWYAAAVAASLVAPFVREQLVVVPAAFAIAWFALWWRSPRSRELRVDWRRGETFGLALLAFGAFVIVNRWLGNRNGPWHTTTDSYKDLIFHHVVWASGALTIGVGVLPLVATLISLFPRRAERLSQHDRAFIALVPSAMVVFALYTGVKAAYLQLTFATRVTERNMIYLAPLLFIGTAVALERRRVRLLPLLGAVTLTAYVIFSTPIQLDYPYFEAFGFSFPTLMNRVFYWSQSTIDVALAITLAASTAVLLVAWAFRGPLDGSRRVAAIAAASLIGLVIVAWNLTGQITAARGSNHFSTQLMDGFIDPPDFVDRATDGAPVTYLGQQMQPLMGPNLVEFWNRSIANVWSIDGTAPPPGPILTPDLVKSDGTLSNPPGTPYLLAGNGLKVVGRRVAARGNLVLYAIDGTIRLVDSETGVYSDGWITSDAAYNRFATPAGATGTVRVTLSRAGYCGEAPQGRATVSVGRLAIGSDKQPAIVETWTTRRLAVPNCQIQTLDIPVGKPPWRVRIRLANPFKASDYGLSDGRELGAVVGFRFLPQKPQTK